MTIELDEIHSVDHQKSTPRSKRKHDGLLLDTQSGKSVSSSIDGLEVVAASKVERLDENGIRSSDGEKWIIRTGKLANDDSSCFTFAEEEKVRKSQGTQ